MLDKIIAVSLGVLKHGVLADCDGIIARAGVNRRVSDGIADEVIACAGFD